MRIRLLPAVLAGALVLPAVLSAQTTLLYEDFNGDWSTTNPPPGWRIYWTGDTSTNDWHKAAANSEPWTDNNTPYAALLNTPSESGTDALISPAINCEAYNYVVLRCSTRVRTSPGPHYSKLLGSVDSGPFEHVIYSYQGVNFEQYQVFDISSWAKNQPEVRLCWRFSGYNELISYWCVDNVSVIGDSSSSDVGVDSILAPSDTVDSGTVVVPEVAVRNYGATPVTDTFRVGMRIGVFYRATTLVTETIPPGSAVRVSFQEWTAAQRGRHPVSAETFLFGDIEPENNSKTGYVFVRVRDVGPLVIISPPDTVDSATVVPIQVQVRNFGNVDADSFQVHFRIGSRTCAPKFVAGLGSGATQTVSFNDWYPDTARVFLARCSTYWYDDINPRNDTLSKLVFVRGAGSIGSEENRPAEPNRLTALPNPARGRVNLSLPRVDIRYVAMYSPTGRLVSRYPCKGRRRLDLDVSGFSPGIYFIRAQEQTCRLVIE
jgi:hypothetical protein